MGGENSGGDGWALVEQGEGIVDVLETRRAPKPNVTVLRCKDNGGDHRRRQKGDGWQWGSRGPWRSLCRYLVTRTKDPGVEG